ncbi:MAG: helix-turn-helix domain-containing protein [Deltaproteobacteria bacterium]|nr:helix-turn-helix domain-containing protein [Deltaproteobacteria bacterium]
MSKDGKELISGMKNVLEYLDGNAKGNRKHVIYVPVDIDVKAIRKKLKLTQKAFADEYGFTVGAVRDWEQGRRTPEKSTRVLLKVIDYNPKIVELALTK